MTVNDFDRSTVPFLEDIPSPLTEKILKGAQEKTVKAGNVIFREGESANLFYVLLQGKAVIHIYTSQRGRVQIQTLHEGDVLGWSWLVPPYSWRFNAVAQETCHLLLLDGKYLRDECDKDHDLGYEIYKRLSRVFTERLRATRVQLLDLYDSPAQGRFR